LKNNPLEHKSIECTVSDTLAQTTTLTHKQRHLQNGSRDIICFLFNMCDLVLRVHKLPWFPTSCRIHCALFLDDAKQEKLLWIFVNSESDRLQWKEQHPCRGRKRFPLFCLRCM